MSTHHLLPRYRQPMRTSQARVAAEAILETGERLPSADDQLYLLNRRDESYLRGIPAVGRNAPGVRPGTMPGSPADHADDIATALV